MQRIVEEFMDTVHPGVLNNTLIADHEYGPLVNGRNNTHEALRHLAQALVCVARANCLDEPDLEPQMGRVQALTAAIVDLLDRPLFTNPNGYRDLIRQQQMRHHSAINAPANKNVCLFQE